MKCNKCGLENENGAKFCASCGAPAEQAPATPVQEAPVQQQIPQQAPPVQQTPPPAQPMQGFNQAPQFSEPTFQPGVGTPVNGTVYLVLSIIVTILCCLPLGIAGIVFATKINQLNLIGDYEGAKKAAKTSMIFTIIGAVSVVVVAIFYFILVAIGAVASYGSYY